MVLALARSLEGRLRSIMGVGDRPMTVTRLVTRFLTVCLRLKLNSLLT